MNFQDATKPLERAVPCPHERTNTTCVGCKVRGVSICAVLDESELGSLEAIAEDVHYDARETILLQDGAADAVYNITQGTVRLYKLLLDGRRQIVGFLLPGDFLGLALSDQYPFSADAVEPVTPAASPGVHFRLSLTRSPIFCAGCMKLQRAS
jgi:CRP/FNR family transcriptional regulator, anaerobic regulatory protein